MASSQQEQILKMRQEIADGDESIGTYERSIRKPPNEYRCNIPANVVQVLGLDSGDSVRMELYLDRVEIRPIVGDEDE